jgi:hypothetical protein
MKYWYIENYNPIEVHKEFAEEAVARGLWEECIKAHAPICINSEIDKVFHKKRQK